MDKKHTIDFENVQHPVAKPIIETIYTADPSARVGADGRMYIYCSHDCYPRGSRGLTGDMDYYHVYSSSDLVEWRDEGEILSSDDVPGILSGDFMWAPDCVYHNGKYYFYFPHPDKAPWGANFQIWVAVSDYPNKDFKVMGYVEGIGGEGMIDPCVLIDDDDRIYLYYGGCGMSKCVELEQDMITPKGEVHDLQGLYDYHEGPWVFKRNGIYYMIHPDEHLPKNRMAFAVSDNPFGPFENKGLYIAPTGTLTTHGSVVEYNGRWFCFYHNGGISGDDWLRSVCVDELFFDDEGNIIPMNQTDYPVISAGEPTPENPLSETFGIERARIIGDVEIQDNEKVVIKSDDSLVQFKKVNGFNGGRCQIKIRYSRKGGNTHGLLYINRKDFGGINILETEEGCKYREGRFTAVLKPGYTNDVTFKYLDGEYAIHNIRIEPLD